LSGHCDVFFVAEAFESAIINVKRLYKSSIQEINKFYLDDADFQGLYFWNNDAKSYIKEIQKTMI
jgi:hypothetical protein